MEIKKLNEEIEALLEREESQEFKDFMQGIRDKETQSLQNTRQGYVDDAITYNKWAQKDIQNGKDGEYDTQQAQNYRDKALELDKKN